VNARVFQLRSAIAEYDVTGAMTIAHGQLLRAGRIFDVCGWRETVQHLHLDEARAVIAQHLNACAKFEWPLLPTLLQRPAHALIPQLTWRDVIPIAVPVGCSRFLAFDVVTDNFDVGEEGCGA
jgi:hypothetical protein